MPTRVVHCKKAPYDVYIGRPGPWGNPYHIGSDGTREEVIEKYRTDLFNDPTRMKHMIKLLKGQTLGCWCKPLSCHGDVIAEICDDILDFSRIEDEETES